MSGSTIKEFKKEMAKIDSLAKDMQMIPHVVILILRDNDIVPDTARHDLSPPVVSVLDLYLPNNLK